MATAEQFRDAKQAVPFLPFTFRLVDGTVYAVNGPDWVSVPPTRRPREVTYYAVIDEDKDQYRTHRIDLNLVAEVILPPKPETSALDPSAGGNGK